MPSAASSDHQLIVSYRRRIPLNIICQSTFLVPAAPSAIWEVKIDYHNQVIRQPLPPLDNVQVHRHIPELSGIAGTSCLARQIIDTVSLAVTRGREGWKTTLITLQPVSTYVRRTSALPSCIQRAAA